MTEVEWDDSEREWMLALEEYRTEILCSVCGMPKEVCRASANEKKWDVGFERCFAAAAIIREQERVTGGDDAADAPGSLAWDIALRG